MNYSLNPRGFKSGGHFILSIYRIKHLNFNSRKRMDAIISMMKRIHSTVISLLKAILIICACAIVGQILLILAYCIPTEPMANNIERGAEALLIQGAEYNYAEDYRESILDNETDAVMLSEALFPEKSCINGAVMIPRYVYADRESQVYSLWAFLNHDNLSNASVANYPRYWHGYLTILKPFLYFFDYSDMKIMNQAIQLVIILELVILMFRNHLEKYCVAFIPMLILWNPATIGVSLQYAACFYVSMIGSLIVLKWDVKNEWMLFLLLGIMTAYLDFLTYPVVTLGIPLVFLIIKNADRISKTIIRIIGNGLFWSIGYIGMWASKWIIGTAISSENVIYDAMFNIENRTSTSVDGEKITRIGTVFRLIQVTFFKWPYLLMLLGVVIYFFVKGYKIFKINQTTISLAVVSLIPVAWFILTANHSYIHPRLVYRDWGITIFSLLSIPIAGASKEKRWVES